MTPTPAVKGLVSFTFDDGKSNQYNYARPLLNTAGFHGTFYIISDAVTWGSSYMSPTEIKALAAEGHEIGNHTRNHANLGNLTQAGVLAEFQQSQDEILASTGITPKNCAYPYGSSNATVEAVAAQFFTSCRTTNGGQNNSSTNRYALKTLYVHTSTPASEIKAAVDEAKANNTWLILCYHGVGVVSSTDDVSSDTMAAHIDVVRASGVPVKSIGEVLK